MLLACSYKEKEFIRVGYYVNNDYAEEEMRENPPAVPELQKIQRHILAEKPRVCTHLLYFSYMCYYRLPDLQYLGMMNLKNQLNKNSSVLQEAN